MLSYWFSGMFLKFLSYLTYKNLSFFHKFTFIICLLVMIALETNISTLLNRVLRIISNTSVYNSIISVNIIFCCLLSNKLYSFYESICITVRIIFYNSDSSINLNALFPIVRFSRQILLYRFKFHWKSSNDLKFV